MKQLKTQWPRVAAEIVSSSHVLVLVDYDCTLMRMTPTSDRATLPASIRSVLRALSRHPRMTIGVISERPVAELRRRVGVRNLIYIGNHGQRVWRVGRQAEVIVPQSFQKTVACIRSKLASVAADIPGALVQAKGLSISLHYRLVATELESCLMGRFASEILPLARASELAVLYGRKVIELCPRVKWIKDHAALWLMKDIHRHSVLPIYIGDDHTDGGACGVLADSITIRVGARAESQAHYYVRDVGEVVALFQWMMATCSTG
ncbi:MAG: trehalose-phosphatase [Candidatus Methylomirabilota bacterium]|nr:trehalose-phosphatase [candidate division NC10 bacterium]PWB47768.1 MAG: trehalose-phosphatase [candidate division NC10 bacterium]